MFSTKKVIATAILGSAIAFPTSTIFTSAAHAEDNITDEVISQEVNDENADIADVDIQDAVIDPYALNTNDCDAVLGVKPGQTQVFDLTKIFNTAQTAKFQLDEQIANLPQVNGWKLNVDGNNLTVVADGDRAPLPVSFGVNVTDEQGKVINGVLSAFTDAKTNTYTNVQQGIDAMRNAVQNGLSVTQAQRQDQNQGEGNNVASENGDQDQNQLQIQPRANGNQEGNTSGYRIIGQGVIRGGQDSDKCNKEEKNPCDVKDSEDSQAEAQYGPKVDTGGSVDTGIIANVIKSIFS